MSEVERANGCASVLVPNEHSCGLDLGAPSFAQQAGRRGPDGIFRDFHLFIADSQVLNAGLCPLSGDFHLLIADSQVLNAGLCLLSGDFHLLIADCQVFFAVQHVYFGVQEALDRNQETGEGCLVCIQGGGGYERVKARLPDRATLLLGRSHL